MLFPRSRNSSQGRTQTPTRRRCFRRRTGLRPHRADGAFALCLIELTLTVATSRIRHMLENKQTHPDGCPLLLPLCFPLTQWWRAPPHRGTGVDPSRAGSTAEICHTLVIATPPPLIVSSGFLRLSPPRRDTHLLAHLVQK